MSVVTQGTHRNGQNRVEFYLIWDFILCVFVGGGVVSTGAPRGRRCQSSMQPQPQAIVRCLPWLIGAKLRPLGKAACVLNLLALSPAPQRELSFIKFNHTKGEES